MLKKTIFLFALLSVLTTFYGFRADFSAQMAADERFGALLDEERLLTEDEYVISAYDNLIRSVSEREGNDWRLMSAIAYHESRFTPDIVSRNGALGLMQIMPVVARQFDVPHERIADPKTNVWLANRLLAELDAMLKIPASTSYEDRMSIVLACYNGGIGHVSDARRLAKEFGEDHNSWSVVSHYLTLLAQPEYYERETVRYGRFTGSRQTLAYVNDVMGRYNRYCRIAAR